MDVSVDRMTDDPNNVECQASFQMSLPTPSDACCDMTDDNDAFYSFS